MVKLQLDKSHPSCFIWYSWFSTSSLLALLLAMFIRYQERARRWSKWWEWRLKLVLLEEIQFLKISLSAKLSSGTLHSVIQPNQMFKSLKISILRYKRTKLLLWLELQVVVNQALLTWLKDITIQLKEKFYSVVQTLKILIQNGTRTKLVSFLKSQVCSLEQLDKTFVMDSIKM